ncbi:hypothetical protein EAE96_008962 [Botrytis aclada]|nr:hypothetical protein EAE96_008962 [Botrytis aclada]
MPEIFLSDSRLFSEANLDSYLTNTLFYTVKKALEHVFKDPPISILSKIPFVASSLKKEGISSVLPRYTPDYSVFRGNINENLVDSHEDALVVGDAKLIGRDNIPDKLLLQKGKSTAQRHHMGQLLWYCCRRKTRFAMHISENYLVVAQFYKGLMTEADVIELERETSKALVQEDAARAKALEDKFFSEKMDDPLDPVTPTKIHKRMKSTSSDSDPESSPASLPKRKKARPEITSATPSESSSSPPRPSPRSSPPSKQGDENTDSSLITGEITPYEEDDSPEVSSQVSQHGGLHIDKVKELSKKDGGFQMRLFTLDLRKPEAKDAPLVVLGIIALAALVDADEKENLRVSRTPIVLTSYF